MDSSCRLPMSHVLGGQPPSPPGVFGGMDQALLWNGRGERKEEKSTPSPQRHSVECAGTGYSLNGCAPAEPFSASPDPTKMAHPRR